MSAAPHHSDTVRLARVEDAAAIARIYNEGIEDRIATFETEPRTPETVTQLLRTHGEAYPTIVLERDGEVVAWAGVSEYRPRACYRGIAEYSVYTAREHRGTGAGRAVLTALLDRAEACGFWKVVSRIFPENEASLTLCDRLGFRRVGVYERHGKLDGEWRDVVVVEKLLGEAAR